MINRENRRARMGKQRNTPGLKGMLDDMLLPPHVPDDRQSDRQVIAWPRR
ncbi:hypothetical protein [Cupriavidus pauculus]|nr:hypothetical protein [Cupriavidus pauculus]